MAVFAGRAVGLDDELWLERPPVSAAANVRGYAGRLRRTFAAVEPGVDRLIRRGSGYVLHLEPDELDLLMFAAEVAEGREALRRGEHKHAAARFADGLGLWRGAIVAGLPRGAARGAEVEDERLTVIEDLPRHTWRSKSRARPIDGQLYAVDHYVQAGYAAAMLLYPQRTPIVLDLVQPGVIPLDLATTSRRWPGSSPNSACCSALSN